MSFAPIGAWLAAHPVAQHALVLLVLGLLTAAINWFVRLEQADAWEDLKKRRPRIAGVIAFLRATGLDPVKALRAVRTMVSGKWAGDVDAEKPKAPSVPPLAVLVLAVFCVGGLGCFRLAQPSPSAPSFGAASESRCEQVADRVSLWSGISAGTAILGGASGAAAGLGPDDKAAKISFGVGALVAGAISSFGGLYSHAQGQTFVDEGCGAKPPAATKGSGK